MSKYLEKFWKPVNVRSLNKQRNSGAMSSFSHNANWYSNLIELGAEREQKLEKYRMMDRSTHVFRALDIIAEDVSSENADDNDVFELDFGDDEKIKPAQLKTIKKTLKIWEKKTEFDYRLFDYIREALKYGIVLFEINSDGSLIKLKQDRIKGFILDENNEDNVEYYLYDRNGAYKNDDGDIIQKTKNIQGSSTKEIDKIPEKNLLVFKISDFPMGESILEKIYKAWRKLELLEDAVVIYRIVRAPERRVFYIDIGRMPSHKAEGHIEHIKNKMRQRQISKDGSIETDYNPASLQEDYFIGQTSDGRGSRVETLSGGENLGRIEDLQYFNKKLALSFRIPPSYMDTFSDDSNGASYNDGRLGTAYIAELRYAGFIKRIQKRFAKELFINFKKFSKKIGTELPEDLGMTLALPQSFAIYKENELFNALLNTYASSDGIESLSKRESMKRFLGMDEDEIVANEQAKLLEMGYSEKEIKNMKPEVLANAIYGDQSIAPTREAAADEDTGGFGNEEGITSNDETGQISAPEPSPADNIIPQ